ncbi:MAG: Gfo/Idh/MocA family oxidoreductase [Pisciglobus halotolerans]|nr:Gfo/Idh/MocA family oxidoreductase [Pisciglobus halotolerans]
MKIGVVGLGNIAQKAYLPVMMKMSDQVDWHLYTRDQDKLSQIGKQYRVTQLYSSIEDLINSGVEGVFIHTATHTHTELVRQFIEKGIHVYVDKPISENSAEVEELMTLAAEKDCFLVTGFNRRFAPMIQELKNVPNKNMIFIQKNKPNSEGSVKFGIFDMFIHVVDTALYLLDEPIESMSWNLNEEAGQLKDCLLRITTSSSICVASMNYVSGANLETAEIQASSGTYRVTNLTNYESDQFGTKTTKEFGDWETTLEKRGFAPIIRAFIESVKSRGENPVSPQSSLKSHQVCAAIVDSAANEKQSKKKENLS